MLKLSLTTTIPSHLGVTRQELENTIGHDLQSLGIAGRILVEVGFVRSDVMQRLNMKYRNIDKPTDVLSFPQANTPYQEIRFLGSIVICPRIAREKNENIRDVIKHGLLHLAGFDHETNQAKWEEAAREIDCQL